MAKSTAVSLPNNLYSSLVDVYTTTHLYSCVMKCITALSLQGNGVFSAYDCSLATYYSYVDCVIACNYFVKLGLLTVLYDAEERQAMSTFKRTDHVILSVQGKSTKRAKKLTSHKEMLAWISSNFNICFELSN